jgi:hypothetical protein
MKKSMLIGLFVILIASFVLAQDIPPAPPITSGENVLSCTDSDGGINYYERGEITTEIIEWNSLDQRPADEGRGQMDSCVEPPKGHPYYLNATQVFVRERYCKSSDDIEVEYEDYDCNSEEMVCWEGACVEETEEMKEYFQQIQQKRENIFKRFLNWFRGLFKRKSNINLQKIE